MFLERARTSLHATSVANQESTSKLLYWMITGAVFFSAFFKIADLDFWWHLKTGEIIVSQKAFQHTEIYSFTVYGKEYVDHEWLFQVIEFLFYRWFGEAGIILLKCALLVLIYLIISRFLVKNQISNRVILAVLFLSVCGARTRFIERPELFTALFLVIEYILIDGYLRNANLKYLAAIPLIMIIWSNVHAAVILGLILQLIFLGGLLIEGFLQRAEYPVAYRAESSQFFALLVLLIASLALTGVNPNGYRILKVPFELTAIIDSGLLQNQEWKQPPLLQLPFFYLCLLFTFGLAVSQFRRLHVVSFLFTAFLGYIALKYVRNIGLFCIMMPLLSQPYLELLEKRPRAIQSVVAVLVIFLILLNIYSPFEFGIGHASYFPDQIVQFTKQKNLQGHMLNSYGFGGYLIWTLYPQRRIFIDGRNEVYLELLKQLVNARGDSLRWRKLLDDYQIEYALLNYTDTLEEVTVMNERHKPALTYAPFSSTHFPRSGWALVYWDDDGMIFVKRKGVNAQFVSSEYDSIYPEGTYYQESLLRAGRIDRNHAIAEVKRKLAEDPNCKRAQRLLQVMSN